MRTLLKRLVCLFKGHREMFMRPFGCEENERVVCLDCGRIRDSVIL